MKPEDAAGHEAKERKTYRPYTEKLHEIINQLEGESFYNGYYLALGFKSGSCRLCSPRSERVVCEALEKGICRFPYKARPSMESVGIDVFATVSGVGWEIFPVGIRSDPSKISCAGVHGLLLVM